MNVLSAILTQIGVKKIHSISLFKQDSEKDCQNCSAPIQSHIVELKPCGHIVCTPCLDFLTDNYTENETILFVCPNCCSKIIDITYK